MSHPSNEPGKTYDVDDRRRAAALAACDGIPTEWLERGVIGALYRHVAWLALCDKMGERDGKEISFPLDWWDRHVRTELDVLNNAAEPARLS